MVDRRTSPRLMRVAELPCPSPAATLRKAGPTSHLGSKIELILVAEVMCELALVGMRMGELCRVGRSSRGSAGELAR